MSEYGVHWNFFVTLFLIWKITDFLHRYVFRNFLPPLSIFILLLYQFFLSKSDLTDFIFAANRNNFLYANREGILSLFGYVPMYLLVESISHYLFFHCDDIASEDVTESIRIKIIINIITIIIVIIIMLIVTEI